VSIIIPTRDRRDLLEPCIRSIEEKTLYPRSKLEILIVDGGSSDPGTLQYLSEVARAERSRLIRDGLPFNYSRINNLAAAQSNNEVLIFLNNDTLINDKHWIDRLVGFAVQKDVGAVGAKLLYPDHTVQHGGVVIGVQGVAAHAHVGLRETDGGYQNLANISHEVSAVTGACLAIRRSVFEEVGGFDEALAVAFNDVKLCLDVLARGYRNVYVAEPIVFHLESKTRGFDDTAEKIAIFHREAAYTRSHHDAIFKEDPYYSANLSLEQTYDLAWPPRRGKPWRAFASRRDASLRVLMLSSTYEIGHGVAVVLNLQAAFLARHGFEVFIGGPAGRNEFGHEGCRRAVLDAPREAASFAVENDIDCIVMHTPPFFSTVRWLGARPRSILYDYGEPNPEYFPNAEERRAVLTEKRFCYEMADKVYTISRAVQQEAGSARADILPLANSHLARWDEDAAARRKSTRAELVLEDKIIVLNVCRFHEEERRYKGIDTYVAVLRDLELQPHWRDKLVFVLCGKATEEDVSAMEAEGLRVFANISDERLTDLYSAADVYMNFSRWEGYNLGIGQALAFGLPVIASNIPAHREFPIVTCDTVEEAVARFAELVEGRPAGDWDNLRTPVISSWDGPLTKLAEIITNVCAEARSA
jgi:GT2 family glycosyltransferase